IYLLSSSFYLFNKYFNPSYSSLTWISVDKSQTDESISLNERIESIQLCDQPVSMHHAPQPVSAFEPQCSYLSKSNARIQPPCKAGESDLTCILIKNS